MTILQKDMIKLKKSETPSVSQKQKFPCGKFKKLTSFSNIYVNISYNYTPEAQRGGNDVSPDINNVSS